MTRWFLPVLAMLCSAFPAQELYCTEQSPQAQSSGEPIQVQIKNSRQKRAPKTKVLVQLAPESTGSDLLELVKADLMVSGQCDVSITTGSCPTTVMGLKALASRYPFALFVRMSPEALEGRLYEVGQGTMLCGKKWQARALHHQWAHKIAQDLWQELMGNRGSFLSRIAYVKREHKSGSKWVSNLWVTDWLGQDPVPVTHGRRMVVAPCWSKQQGGMILFYSEFTRRNVRLLATDVMGKIWPVIDSDGTNYGVSCRRDGQEVVYCHSGQIWKSFYDSAQKKSTHKLLVEDGGTCASPSLMESGDVLYCSGGKLKIWRAASAQIDNVGCQGFCTGPSWHEGRGQIVYAKRIAGNMQLFVYDMKRRTDEQITAGPGDKIDPSWSPCGSFVAYCLDKGKESSIMILHVGTQVTRKISPDGEHCSCPAWSPWTE